MAITKLLHINSAKGNPMHRTLGRAITYILNPHKTDEGILVGSVNCKAHSAYEEMVQTKEFYGKTDLRQGYHFVISFKPGETDAETAMEIIKDFVREFLGNGYEAVYAVHINTEAIHGHVVFNSVSFLDGRKYHYDNGDWKRDIQPLVNRLCANHGLSVIDPEKKAEPKQLYKDIAFGAGRLGGFRRMILRDIDAAVMLATDFEQFKEELRNRGYEVKCGKHFAIRPPAMTRFCRTGSLGEEYGEERLRERIKRKKFLSIRQKSENNAPRIGRCYVGRLRRRVLTPIQKRYIAKLYRTGRLRKRSYSQAYKFKDEIKRLKEIQEQSLLLLKYNVKGPNDLISLKERLNEENRRVSREKKRLYRERKLFGELTTEKGYTEEEIAEIREQVESDLKLVKADESKVRAEIKALDRVIRETIADAADTIRNEEKIKLINETKDKLLEPERKRRTLIIEKDYERQR